MTTSLRIGTRGSPLALTQAQQVRDRLATAWPDLAGAGAIAIEVIATTGDRIQDRRLAEIGGKGLFTKEIEEALANGTIDIAVHSMKDVPTWLPDGLVLSTILPREDPRDALFAAKATSLATLPEGAVVGTSSLRRQAQLLAARPDCRVVSLRGNVDTRLAKLAAGTVDATMLAVAGLNRLGRQALVKAPLSVTEMLPAVAQGAIGLEIRQDDDATARRVAALACAPSTARVAAERALLARLDGNCTTPIAALAELDGDRLSLAGLLAAPDGSRVIRAAADGQVGDATAIGRDVGDRLLADAGPDFVIAR